VAGLSRTHCDQQCVIRHSRQFANILFFHVESVLVGWVYDVVLVVPHLCYSPYHHYASYRRRAANAAQHNACLDAQLWMPEYDYSPHSSLSSRESSSSLASKLSKRHSLEIDLHPSRVQTPYSVAFSYLGGGLGIGLKCKNRIRKSSSSRSLVSSVSSIGSVGSVTSTTSLPVQPTPRARLTKSNNNPVNTSSNGVPVGAVVGGDATSAVWTRYERGGVWLWAKISRLDYSWSATGCLDQLYECGRWSYLCQREYRCNMFGRDMRKLAGLYSTAPSSFNLL
jgi:hypothetical protein